MDCFWNCDLKVCNLHYKTTKQQKHKVNFLQLFVILEISGEYEINLAFDSLVIVRF